MKKSNQKSKAKFRASKEWKEYRESILASRGSQCQCCYRKLPSSRLQLHHKDLNAENYEDLTDEKKHVLLCSNCHKIVHSLYSMVNNKKNKQINVEMLEFVSPYFILSEHLKEFLHTRKNR